jgi:hypothetical protein
LFSHSVINIVLKRDRPVIRIRWGIIVTQLVDDIRQGVVFPANQNIARPGVTLNHISDTLGIIAITGCVDNQSQVFCERLYGLVRTSAFAIWIDMSAEGHF